MSVKFTPTDTTDYTTATATQKLIVNKAVPVITWPAPAAITYPTPLSSAQLNATANVPGTFVYSPAAGTVLTANIRTLSVKFTPTDTTDYTTATATQKLTVNKAVPVITWAAPAAITYGTPLSATQLNATANVPGAFVYTPAAGTVLTAGTQTLSVKFTPTDTTDYTTATATQTLTVTSVDNTTFLRQLFPLVLGRQITPEELSTLSAAMSGGLTRSEVYGKLINSAEYTGRQIDPVIRLYCAALAQAPDYTGLQSLANALHAGTLTLTEAAGQFTSNPEFILRYGSLDNTQYVQQLYRDLLGREADAVELANRVGQLAAGAARGTVLAGLSESGEFKENTAYWVEILRLYFLLQQRMPTAAEVQGWIEFLQGDGQADTPALCQQEIDDWMNCLPLTDEMSETILDEIGAGS